MQCYPNFNYIKLSYIKIKYRGKFFVLLLHWNGFDKCCTLNFTLLTSRFVIFLLTFPSVTVVCDNFRLSSLSFQTTTASCPPSMKMSSRNVEKAKHDATNGRAEVRLLTVKTNIKRMNVGHSNIVGVYHAMTVALIFHSTHWILSLSRYAIRR